MGKKFSSERVVPRKDRPLWPDDSYCTPRPRLTRAPERRLDEQA